MSKLKDQSNDPTPQELSYWLDHLEGRIRDAWAWSEGEHRVRLSDIAVLVQQAKGGIFIPAAESDIRLSIAIENVHYLPFDGGEPT